MVRWIILACLVVVLTVAGTLAVLYSPDTSTEPAFKLHRAAEGPPPKLEVVGPTQFNFGTMPKHANGSHSWEIKNVGAGPLNLWVEETSCSCTVAKLSDQESKEKGEAKKTIKVPPGKSSPIDVNWETRDWSGFAQTVTLGTNDPEKSTVYLLVKGKVLHPVEVEPSSTVTFANASNEENHRATLTILSPDRPGLKLTKIVNSNPGLIVAETKPMTPEELAELKVKSGYHLAIELKPGMPLGPFREELVIQTDHPDMFETKVTVGGNITGPITVFPAKLEMFNVSSRDGASRDLSLTVRGGRETRFEVAGALEKVRVAIVPDDRSSAKGRYRLTITVPPGTSAGLIKERIVLKTDHPQVSQIEIPVSIYITRASAG
ncbi:MAG: DUF1573 domain-containing protein [Isosphaeraceae bacterium]